MIFCVLVNDGTVLKLVIEFDFRLKENIGLKIFVDIYYVKENLSSFSDYFKDNIVIEVIVLFLIFFDNFCFFFVVVDYCI